MSYRYSVFASYSQGASLRGAPAEGAVRAIDVRVGCFCSDGVVAFEATSLGGGTGCYSLLRGCLTSVWPRDLPRTRKDKDPTVSGAESLSI